MDKCQAEFNSLLNAERASYNNTEGEGEGKMEVDGDVAAAVVGTLCLFGSEVICDLGK